MALAATFGRETDEAMLMGYSMALDDIPVDRIELAVRRALRECKFMPSGAELRRLSGELSSDSRVVLAWSAVKQAVSLYGYTKSVDFDDPVINATIRVMGGWQLLCDTDAGEAMDVWTRKRFVETYTGLLDGGVSDDLSRPLEGYHDLHNSARGYLSHVREPVRMVTGLPVVRRVVEQSEQPLIGCEPGEEG